MSAPLLFLGHAADRTGPPIYLRHFLRWLRANQPEVDFEIALLTGGELEDDFRELGPTSVGGATPDPSWDADQHAARFVRIEEQMAGHAGCDVVYINATPCAEMARLLPEGERAIISHVHELEIGLSHWVQPRDRHVLLERADRIFSVADAVTRNLVTNHGVSPDLISRHPGMVDLREIEDPPVEEARRESRRARGLPAEGLIVGTSGTVYWRKAFDLFLQLAARLTADTRPEPVSFVWLGGEPGAIGHATRLAEILGVADLVHFVETQPDPIEWFSLMDVFVLPSREDPFPLVCLEALSVGVPVVAFDTGGMPELLDQGCGLVSPYPDLHDLARKVDSLLSDPELRRTLGDRGRELIRSGYDVSVLAPRLWADISPWLP